MGSVYTEVSLVPYVYGVFLPRGEDTRKGGVSVKIYINFYTKIADYDLLAVFILGGGR